ncbi:MAG: hypothetical protein NDI60_03170 [Elusimicrobiales bacterium]|nr:hypothetical protein [Elusimicrobiales bacterium]
MKTILTVLLFAACAAPACAQTAAPAGTKSETAPAPGKKAAKAAPADAQKPAAPAAAKPAAAQKAAARPAPKPADQEAEESVVMIDSKGDPDETGRFSAGSYGGDQEDPSPLAGGMPASYGQLKGVMNDGGRSLLVLESPEDGAITFVQVTAGKAGVTWKLVDRILRSAD